VLTADGLVRTLLERLHTGPPSRREYTGSLRSSVRRTLRKPPDQPLPRGEPWAKMEGRRRPGAATTGDPRCPVRRSPRRSPSPPPSRSA
jgi:hypothetical protein